MQALVFYLGSPALVRHHVVLLCKGVGSLEICVCHHLMVDQLSSSESLQRNREINCFATMAVDDEEGGGSLLFIVNTGSIDIWHIVCNVSIVAWAAYGELQCHPATIDRREVIRIVDGLAPSIATGLSHNWRDDIYELRASYQGVH